MKKTAQMEQRYVVSTMTMFDPHGSRTEHNAGHSIYDSEEGGDAADSEYLEKSASYMDDPNGEGSPSKSGPDTDPEETEELATPFDTEEEDVDISTLEENKDEVNEEANEDS